LDRTVVAGTAGYDLSVDAVDILDASWQDPSDATRWTRVESWQVQRDTPAAQFPSGVALFLPQPTNTPIRVRYRTTFGVLSTLFDDVLGVTGLPESALDLLALGASIDLMAGRPVQRVFNNAQPDPRDSAEVRVSDVLNAVGLLRVQFQQRVNDEADKLRRLWPQHTHTRRLMDTSPRRRWRA
jgi:hypothetical protein